MSLLVSITNLLYSYILIYCKNQVKLLKKMIVVKLVKYCKMTSTNDATRQKRDMAWKNYFLKMLI